MLLEVKNLSVRLKSNNKIIIKDSSFNVDEGETLGIIGESGSGKTITNKAIMGLLNPKVFIVKGSIKWKDVELLHSNKNLRKYRGTEIAMIMQNPMTAFAPMTKIGKQLITTLKFHSKLKRNEIKSMIKKSLESINLYDFNKIMKSYPNELSGGMLQRIMIALTLLIKPELIIADEATTAVDAVSEKLIIEDFKKIQNQNISMIVITHDFGVAATLCKNILVMKDGEIIEAGRTKNVLNSPQHKYTKELVKACILNGDESC